MNSFLLQQMTLPRVETTEPLLYVRTDGEVQFADGRAILRVGAELSFDTSFGAFAAGRWRRLSVVENLSATILVWNIVTQFWFAGIDGSRSCR